MAQHEAFTTWTGDDAFDSVIEGHTIHIDARMEREDSVAPSPKRLLLSGLAGCSGADVVSLLRKMRVPFTGLEIDVEADLTEEHPKVYHQIRMVYKVYGERLAKDKVEKAVRLSQDRYCGVSAMLAKGANIDWRIELLPSKA